MPRGLSRDDLAMMTSYRYPRQAPQDDVINMTAAPHAMVLNDVAPHTQVFGRAASHTTTPKNGAESRFKNEAASSHACLQSGDAMTSRQLVDTCGGLSQACEVDPCPPCEVGPCFLGPCEAGPCSPAPMCVVCLEAFRCGEEVRVLPCAHEYHTDCVDTWLQVRPLAPVAFISIDYFLAK